MKVNIGGATPNVTTTFIERIQLTADCRAEEVVDLRDHVTIPLKSRSFVFDALEPVKQLISIVRHSGNSSVMEAARKRQLVIIEGLAESA